MPKVCPLAPSPAVALVSVPISWPPCVALILSPAATICSWHSNQEPIYCHSFAVLCHFAQKTPNPDMRFPVTRAVEQIFPQLTTNYVLHALILWVRNLDREQWRWLVSVPWSLGCSPPDWKAQIIWKLTHSHIWWVMQAVGWDLCLAFSLNNSAWLLCVAWSSSQHGGWVPRRRRNLDWAPNLRS